MNESTSRPSSAGARMQSNAGMSASQRPPGWLFLFTLPFRRPTTASARVEEVSLRRAWVVHVLATTLTVLVILLLVVLSEAGNPLTAGGLAAEISKAATQMASEFRRFPKETVGGVVAVFAIIEVGFVVVALIGTAWGAGDESIRSSYCHALRHVWLQTVAVLPAVLAVGSLIVVQERAEQAWQNAAGAGWSSFPKRPANAASGTQAFADYQAAIKQFYQRRTDAEQARPWYWRVFPIPLVLTGIGFVAWFFWTLFRQVGVSRNLPTTERPPKCEACGYNLHTIPMDSRCPECGLAVLSSLGPDVRPGNPWENRGGKSSVRAWLHTALCAIRDGEQFGRLLRIESKVEHHRRFLGISLVVAVLIGIVGFMGCGVVVALQSNRIDEQDLIMMGAMCLVFGFLSGLTVVILTLTSSVVVGCFFWRSAGRNLLPGAIQISSYLSGYVVLWVALTWTLGALIIYFANWFFQDAPVFNLAGGTLIFFAWFLPNLTCLIVYFVLVTRGTRGLIHANK